MHEFWKRVRYAFRCYFSILLHGNIPQDIARELVGTSAQPQSQPVAGPSPTFKVTDAGAAAESPDRAVQMLALLQRDGRFIDFLTEDVSAYPDGQLGAAVRTIHASCRQVLERYLKLEPILNSAEDQPVTLQAGVDPASIKLIGNVTGEPPVRGLLRHRGWRVREVNLPSLPEGEGRKIVAPAEVEMP